MDASYDSLDSLIGSDTNNAILEVWKWNPAFTIQFVKSPQQPLQGSDWLSWVRGAANQQLQRFIGDSAYLVRVGTNVAAYTWRVKGRPVVPRHVWNVSGLNLLGFSTVPGNPPTFDAFLTQSPDLKQAAEIYQYVGGNLSSNNPIRMTAQRVTAVKRGQAFWIRSGTLFNSYFGPFEVEVSNSRGIDFRDTLSTYRVRLRNLTANNLTVTARLFGSDAPPAGQPAISGTPSLLVRGNINTTNLSYGYAALPPNGTQSWPLAPKGAVGSELEVVFGVNRGALAGNVGDLLAGILRFTDSLGQLQVDVPVSVTVASMAGLWIGGADVIQVQHYLKAYQRENSGLVTSSNGQYVVTNINTSLGAVARSFPLRLIVHNPSNSANAVLLQRVYIGLDAQTNTVVATSESALSQTFLSQSRRVTATHLPWTGPNLPWSFNQKLQPGANITATVLLSYDDQPSNPFLHTYHPDHDNLDPQFISVQPQGAESYSVRRDITLNPRTSANDFDSLTSSGQTLSGDYLETITLSGLTRAAGGTNSRQFQVRGIFTLNRIADIPSLTTTP